MNPVSASQEISASMNSNKNMDGMYNDKTSTLLVPPLVSIPLKAIDVRVFNRFTEGVEIGEGC
jgi:hypothetical protein